MSLFPHHRTLMVKGSHLPVSEFGTDYLTVKSVSGHEYINELFEYRIELRTRDEYGNPVGGFLGMDGFISKATAEQGGSPGSNWNLAATIGTQVHVAIQCDGKVDSSLEEALFALDIARHTGELLPARLGAFTRHMHGLITRAEQTGVEGRSALYTLTLRPWLWLLTQTNNYRIFQQQSPIDTITQVLSAYPYRTEWRLSQSYPSLDYQVQYNESDFSFVQRLCAEYGLNYWFEHTAEEHILVIADSLAAFEPMESVAYQTLYTYPPNLKLQEEYIHSFSPAYRHTVGKVMLSDYEFKTPRADLAVKSEHPPQTDWDGLEVYSWQQGDFLAGNGEVKAEHALQALRQHAQRMEGAGNLRGLQTGRTFSLANHPSELANRSWLLLGQSIRLQEIATESQGARGFSTQTEFRVQPDTEPLRPEPRPKPVADLQTATVVGPVGREMWTDAYGRVKIRFHWHRDDPANEQSSCWVRVMEPWAGQEYGGVHLPRIGQEVLVDFLGGDPDMPMVVGRVTNPTQMPPWSLPSQYVLSGVRSKELDGSRNNIWLMDDTPSEVQVQLSSDHQSSSLSLGHVTRISGTPGRADFRGRGFELRTDGHGALRAHKGFMLTTYGRIRAAQHVTDMDETSGLLKGAHAQQKSFTQLAHDHHADERAPEETLLDRLKSQNEQIGGQAQASEGFPELTEPHGVLSSPAGVALTAAQSTHLVAKNMAVTSGRDVSMSVGARLLASTGKGISLFTQSLGMRAFAAKGKVQIQAQSDDLELFADQVAKFISAKKSIQIAAKDEILLTAKGSYIKINGSGIEQGTPATHIVYAATKAMLGPKSLDANLPEFKHLGNYHVQFVFQDDDGNPYSEHKYHIWSETGQSYKGVTDAEGKTQIIYSPTIEEFQTRLIMKQDQNNG